MAGFVYILVWPERGGGNRMYDLSTMPNGIKVDMMNGTESRFSYSCDQRQCTFIMLHNDYLR